MDRSSTTAPFPNPNPEIASFSETANSCAVGALSATSSFLLQEATCMSISFRPVLLSNRVPLSEQPCPRQETSTWKLSKKDASSDGVGVKNSTLASMEIRLCGSHSPP